MYIIARPTPSTRVAAMNAAFGNPPGDFNSIDFTKVFNQSRNIFDEYLELLHALGVPAESLGALRQMHASVVQNHTVVPSKVSTEDVRDALCDVQVFAQGAQYFMGVNSDDDMHAVIDGVMTRFIKDEADFDATVAMHAAKGVTQTYTEGQFPTMVLKSKVDQPDAPKGKFLKSASYSPAVFPNPNDGCVEEKLVMEMLKPIDNNVES